jgi:hypothetical protein
MSKLEELDNYHLISNFPKNLSLFRRFLSQLAFLLLATKVTKRKNRLTVVDYRQASEIIEKGDVILAGGFRSVSGLFLGKLFTHILLYQGEGQCIHASADGVDTVGLDELFDSYDNLAILRPRINDDAATEKMIEVALSFAQEQIGKPYDFYFKHTSDRYYCTFLIDTAFSRAGFDTGLKIEYRRKKPFLFARIHKALKADDFLHGNFHQVFISDSLKGREAELDKLRNIYAKNTLSQ